MPLKKIPNVISPHLLQVLALMGHGDEIVLADAHFPSSSICRSGPIEVRADGMDIPTLLDAVLQLLPLDQYENFPVSLMDLVQSDKDRNLQTPVWSKYREIINKHESSKIQIEKVERFAFYEKAKKAFAVVHTGETAQYGNIILKKGVAL
ncbi:fucose mutarotase-like [Mytilus californianus]|uniref:fucose mutarotase-like n=1 Tax=Mytilus californianus TaxID=6549 RepID=UPI0022467BAB|nr:fucose mutarotase-like [Mytilus californianus]